jgi:nitrate/nitrite transporter NarK
MQEIGFMMCFVLFTIPAFLLKYYEPYAHIHSFQAMYFLSSFFNPFGRNCTTFLVTADVFLTPIRGTAHGLSAAAGKFGALVIAVVGPYTTTQQQFYIVPWSGLAGVLLTERFLPDTTGFDLREQERRWLHIRQGREHEYHSLAIRRRHLSIWERWMGKGKYCNADLDYQMKVKEFRVEFRVEWEAAIAVRGEDEDALFDLDDVDESIL